MLFGNKEPSESEVRKAFEDVQAAWPDYYKNLNLNDLLLGFCLAKGMTAKQAVPFVQQNGVKEDGT